MISSRILSLRWNLALIIFACVFLPSSLVISLAYDALFSVTHNEKIDIVGAVAQSRYETLKVLLERSQQRTDASLIEIERQCGSFKNHQQCYENALQGLIQYVKAEGAAYIDAEHTPIKVGTNAAQLPRSSEYAPGQIAYFSPHIPNSVPTYYIISVNPKNKSTLLINYSSHALQTIFNTPKELGNSGRTFLANSKGIFISNVHNLSLINHHTHFAISAPMQRCLVSGNGEALDLDFRGIPTVHGFRFIKEIGDGCIMANMEQAEAFSAVNHLQRSAVVAIVIVTLLGLLAAFLLSRRIIAPINKLTKTITHFDLNTFQVSNKQNSEKSTYKEVHELQDSFHALVKKLRIATKDSDALLSALNFHAIVSMTDKAGNITQVNDVFCKISGYSREELIGKNHRIINSGMHDNAFWKNAWSLISKGHSWHGEVCNRAKNGELYWVDSVIVPFKNEDNEIDKYVSIRINITESKKNAQATMAANAATRAALEELRIIQERNAFALDGSGDGVWDWDIKNSKVMLSKRWKSMIGHEENEIGDEVTEWSTRLHPDDAANVMADVQANLDGKTKSFSNQHRVRCKNGSYLWILDRGQVVARDAQGNALRMIGTHTDISKQKEMERIKAEFISTVSHELRTPITSIRGALGLIESGVLGEVAPKAMDLVKIANRNSQRLITLVNDILDMDKLLSGKMPLHIDVIDMKQIIFDAISANMSYANLFDIHFQFQPSVETIKAMGDYNRLMQVFTNLLSNAAKFSYKGSDVELRIHSDDEWVFIEVEDHGEGIPKDFQNQVFEAFAQADSGDTRKQGSTGLGLNISKKLIEAMGGEIGFSSVAKVGTTFTIKLPLYKEIL